MRSKVSKRWSGSILFDTIKGRARYMGLSNKRIKTLSHLVEYDRKLLI